MLSLTIEEVERHLHVRAAFLRALERGALEELPSPVQTRGMFANYASFLDLDVDLLLLRFADGLQMRHRERHPQKPKRGKPIKVNEKVPPLSAFVAGDLLIGGGMAILLILFTIWGVSRVIVMRSQFYPQVTAPAILEYFDRDFTTCRISGSNADPSSGYSFDCHAPGNRHHCHIACERQRGD